MNRHPGGEEHTRRMMSFVEWNIGNRILDLGAGSGETVSLLRSLGLWAVGIDQKPGSELVEQGDFLDLPFSDGSMDFCISQCALWLGKDVPGALKEAARVLKHGGCLMLSDLDPGELEVQMEEAGFTVIHKEDMTKLWKEYYIAAIWTDSFCCEEYELLAKRYHGKKLKYTMLIGRKE